MGPICQDLDSCAVCIEDPPNQLIQENSLADCAANDLMWTKDAEQVAMDVDDSSVADGLCTLLPLCSVATDSFLDGQAEEKTCSEELELSTDDGNIDADQASIDGTLGSDGCPSADNSCDEVLCEQAGIEQHSSLGTDAWDSCQICDGDATLSYQHLSDEGIADQVGEAEVVTDAPITSSKIVLDGADPLQRASHSFTSLSFRPRSQSATDDLENCSPELRAILLRRRTASEFKAQRFSEPLATPL